MRLSIFGSDRCGVNLEEKARVLFEQLYHESTT